MDKRRLVMTVLLTSMLAACAVGPDYQRPAMPMTTPAQFARAETVAEKGAEMGAENAAATSAVTSALTPTATQAEGAEFWRSFNDPELTALIGRALSANNDLRVALARYDSDNALLREAKFDRYPTMTASALGATSA